MDVRLLILTFSCICFLQTQIKEVSGSTIRIAWLAPAKYVYYFNASTSLGALAYALDTITADATLLPGYTFDVKYEDSNCNSKSGIGAIFNIMTSNYNPHLILGPACSPAMDPVAQLGSIHNLPVFGWIASDPDLADKTKFNTLVRLLGSVTATGEGMFILLKQYTWRRVALISTTGPDYSQLVAGIRDTLIRHAGEGYEIARWEQDIPLSVSSSRIAQIYSSIKHEARVVILCIPLAELRTWMLAAYDAGMVGGDFVFIYTNQIIPSEDNMADFASTSFYAGSDGRQDAARVAYQNLIMVYQKTLNFNQTNDFLNKFEVAARGGSWSSMTGVSPATPDLYSLFLYDALLLYAKLATEVGSVDNGTAIFEAARDKLVTGSATGTILMSDSSDRSSDYWILDMNSQGVFDVAGATDSSTNGTFIQRVVEIERDIIWGDGTSGWANRPLDVPLCGFRNELCVNNLGLFIAAPTVTVAVVAVVIIVFLVYRSWAREKDLNNMYWKIDYNDLNLFRNRRGFGSQSFVSLSRAKVDSSSFAESVRGQLFVKVANFRGRLVAVKDVRKTKVKIDRALLEEFRMMSQIKHNNLLTFIGASVEEPNICAVWEYCSKGSLQDVIWNDNITLDDMFKFSISLDIAKGLHYLHGSCLKHHGRLKSNNVVIDGRWVCKLADFGLRPLTVGQDEDPDSSEHVVFSICRNLVGGVDMSRNSISSSGLMWTAPELLRTVSIADRSVISGRGRSEPGVSQPGDIYAIGVLLKEIFCRSGPYTEYEYLTPQEVIEKVCVYQGSGDPFRPDLSMSTGTHAMNDLIRSCWEEDPKDRPPVQTVLKRLSAVNPFKKANVMDNMISMMEKYSNHLEEIVADRTMALEEEKKKTENLLYRMLPRSVAEDLKLGRPIAAESFDSVTIYFSDIVRFTDLAGESSPLQVVTLLNELYTLFDSVIANHDVYKVETIGDAYMIVSGLPVRNGDRHAAELVNCSLDLLSGVLNFKVPHKPDYKMSIRIGVHTGPCVSGVVGLTMPRYCLFGDTVNTASRMESNGQALRIHLSPTTTQALSQFSGYQLADRGGMQIKGKGFMKTCWLLGHKDFNKPLPDFSKLSKEDEPAPKLLPMTSGDKPWKMPRRPDPEPLTILKPEKQKISHPQGEKRDSVVEGCEREETEVTEVTEVTSLNSEKLGRNEISVIKVHQGAVEKGDGAGQTSVRLPPIGDGDKVDGLQREGTIHADKLPPIGSSGQS